LAGHPDERTENVDADDIDSYTENLSDNPSNPEEGSVTPAKTEDVAADDIDTYQKKLSTDPTDPDDGSVTDPKDAEDFTPKSFDDSISNYREKLGGVENLQTDVDSQSLTTAERIAATDDPDTPDIEEEYIPVSTPKTNNERQISDAFSGGEGPVAPERGLVSDPKDDPELSAETYYSKVDTYRSTISEANETEAEDAETAEEAVDTVGVLNPKDTPSHLTTLPEPITEGRSLDTQGADGDEQANPIYQPFGDKLDDVGDIVKRSLGVPGELGDVQNDYDTIRNNTITAGGASWGGNEREINVFDPESKVENSLTSNDFKFLLYTNIPYIIGRVAGIINGAINAAQEVSESPENLAKQIGTIRLALDTFVQTSYWTIEEGVRLLGATFATLQLIPAMKGIEIKYKRRYFNSLDVVPWSEESGNFESTINAPVNADRLFSFGSGFSTYKEYFNTTFEWLINTIKSLDGRRRVRGETGNENAEHWSEINTTLDDIKSEMVKAVQEQIDFVFEGGLTYFQKGSEPLESSERSAPAFTNEAKLPLTGEDPKQEFNNNNGEYEFALSNILNTPDAEGYDEEIENSPTYNELGEVLRDRIGVIKDKTKESINLFGQAIDEKLNSAINNEKNIITLLSAISESTNSYNELLNELNYRIHSGPDGDSRNLPIDEGRMDAIKESSDTSRNDINEKIIAANSATTTELENMKVDADSEIYGDRASTIRGEQDEGFNGRFEYNEETQRTIKEDNEDIDYPEDILANDPVSIKEDPSLAINDLMIKSADSEIYDDRTTDIINAQSNSMEELNEDIKIGNNQVLEKTAKENIRSLIRGLLSNVSDFETEMRDSEKIESTGIDSTSTKEIIWGESAYTNLRQSITNYNTKYDFIKNFKQIWSIGYIIVYPTLEDGGAGAAFKIPIQFNPLIQESGAAVRYESQQLLHRQGSLYSYVGTEAQTLTIETEYLMTTDGKDDDRDRLDTELGGDVTWSVYNGPQDAWYKAWSPTAIQSIESALRSIALPQMSGGGDTDIKFHRPPMIKIVFGKNANNPTSWDSDKLHPMLTYPVKSGDDTKYYHRTYLVSKVSIEKNVEETPLHLDENGNLLDTHGFKVSLELNEVDSNYIGIMPDFGDYYASYNAQELIVEDAG